MNLTIQSAASARCQNGVAFLQFKKDSGDNSLTFSEMCASPLPESAAPMSPSSAGKGSTSSQDLISNDSTPNWPKEKSSKVNRLMPHCNVQFPSEPQLTATPVVAQALSGLADAGALPNREGCLREDIGEAGVPVSSPSTVLESKKILGADPLLDSKDQLGTAPGFSGTSDVISAEHGNSAEHLEGRSGGITLPFSISRDWSAWSRKTSETVEDIVGRPSGSGKAGSSVSGNEAPDKFKEPFVTEPEPFELATTSDRTPVTEQSVVSVTGTLNTAPVTKAPKTVADGPSVPIRSVRAPFIQEVSTAASTSQGNQPVIEAMAQKPVRSRSSKVNNESPLSIPRAATTFGSRPVAHSQQQQSLIPDVSVDPSLQAPLFENPTRNIPESSLKEVSRTDTPLTQDEAGRPASGGIGEQHGSEALRTKAWGGDGDPRIITSRERGGQKPDFDNKDAAGDLAAKNQASAPVSSPAGITVIQPAQVTANVTTAGSESSARPSRTPDHDSNRQWAADVSTMNTGSVHLARLMDRTSQAEMRIGLNTSAFGNVEVRTVAHANEVGVVIGSEKGDLRSMIGAELPSIADSLQQQHVRLVEVSFHQQGLAPANDFLSGGHSQSRSFEAKPDARPAFSREPISAESDQTSEPAHASRIGLSILA